MEGTPKQEPTPTFQAGEQVGSYRLEAFVASGGMAEVYRARHLKLDKVVAIKFLDRKNAEREDVVQRFLREGRFASELRHPHVVEVSDVSEHAGLPYMVMEFLEGETLSDFIRREAPLDPEVVATIMLPVCAAVATAHEKGVLHRDLKPGNVFLAESSVGEVIPKVLDFGISKSIAEDADSALTISAAFLGTPTYLSPEQAAGEDGTPRSDQYSLGVILYEAATGKRAFEGEKKLIRLLRTIAEGRFDKPHVHHESISEELEAVVLRAMNTDPNRRYESVVALAEALLPLADERTASVWKPRLDVLATGEPAPLSRTHSGGMRVPEPETVHGTATSVSRLSSGGVRSGQPGWLRPAVLVPALLLAALLVWQLSGSESTTPVVAGTGLASSGPASFAVRVAVEPPDASLVLDGKPVGKGHLDLLLPRDGAMHHLEITAPGYVTRQFTFRDAPPPEKVTLKATPTAAPSAEPTASATATAAAEPSAEPSAKAAKKGPNPRDPKPKGSPKPGYTAHPDNIDPWNE